MLRLSKRWPIVAGIVAATLFVAPTIASPRPSVAATVSVDIVDFAFSPAAITIDVGDTVSWANSGAAPHTATSDVGQADAWDSGTLATGQQFSRVFSVPGTFTYFCAIHPFMRGSVTVREAPTATATSSPTATATPTTASGTPTSTPQPSATPTRTTAPETATPTAVATAPTAAASPAPPEDDSPAPAGGDTLAAVAAPAEAELPSAGQAAKVTAGHRAEVAVAVGLLYSIGLASLWWSRRRA